MRCTTHINRRSICYSLRENQFGFYLSYFYMLIEPFHQRFFHHKLNSIKIWFGFRSNSNKAIATAVLSWHVQSLLQFDGWEWNYSERKFRPHWNCDGNKYSEMCPWHQLRINVSFTHYDDVIMSAIASQITSLIIVYSIVYSDADQRNHQSSASLAFVCGIHRGPVNSPHKWPETRKMFPCDDVIM